MITMYQKARSITCWTITHTRKSKLLGGTRYFEDFWARQYDNPASLTENCKRKYHIKPVKGHYHGPQDKVQQRGIFSVRLHVPKTQVKKATQPCCQETGMLAFLYSISQCRMQRHSNQDWILGHFIYLDSKMGLCKTRLYVKDKKHLVFASSNGTWSDRFTFRNLHGKQTWHPFSKGGK